MPIGSLNAALDTQEKPVNTFQLKEELFASLLHTSDDEDDHEFEFLNKARTWDDIWPILDMPG